MNTEQIEHLSAALDDGNNGQVYYKTDKGLISVAGIIEGSIRLNDGSYYFLNKINFDDFYLVRPVSDLFE